MGNGSHENRNGPLGSKQSLGIIAHEIKSPISSVIQLLQSAEILLQDSDQAEALALVQRAIKRARNALQISRGLLDYLKVDTVPKPAGEHELVPADNIQPLIEAQIQMAFNRDVRLEHELRDTHVRLRINQFEWDIVVSNLISNAIRYSKRDAGTQTVWIRTFKREKSFVFEVRDQGIGMSDDEKNRIFDGFYRSIKAKEQTTSGSGFGLAMVKKIVEDAGGAIECVSAPGVGTTFRVFFPISGS